MRKILFILGLLLTLSALPALASNESQDFIAKIIPNAQSVGQGRLTFMMWDVYDATLFAPQGRFETGKPFALSLKYLRDIEGRKIADRSIDEIRRLGFNDEVALATWHTQMKNIFPDVTNGSVLTGVYNPQTGSVFYFNGIEIGQIKDKTFGEYFFNIWLDPNTSAPDLRAQLLGKP